MTEPRSLRVGDGSHASCTNGHTCQVPSGRTCIEDGCNEPAGTKWGPLWCPDHDKERLDRITASLESILADMGGGQR
jgi:hypothetical protein